MHPGGPFWANKDAGAWSIPKGEYTDEEDARACAAREFEEELGSPLPAGADLTTSAPSSCAAASRSPPSRSRATSTPTAVTSNTFTMQWPPRSGQMQEFPEVDRAGWFGLDEARERLNPAQAELLDRL